MRRRRWLQFSLSSIFLLVTVLGVWLGIVVNQAREQREAVAAIKAAGGVVYYDWEEHHDPFGDEDAVPPGPAWLRRFIGDDFFLKANIVSFRYMPDRKTTEILNLVPHLRRLGSLEAVFVPARTSQGTVDKLRAALPDCDEITVDLSGF